MFGEVWFAEVFWAEVFQARASVAVRTGEAVNCGKAVGADSRLGIASHPAAGLGRLLLPQVATVEGLEAAPPIKPPYPNPATVKTPAGVAAQEGVRRRRSKAAVREREARVCMRWGREWGRAAGGGRRGGESVGRGERGTRGTRERTRRRREYAVTRP